MKKIKEFFKKIFKKKEIPVVEEYVDIAGLLSYVKNSSEPELNILGEEFEKKLQEIELKKEKLKQDIEYYENKKQEAVVFLDKKLQETEKNIVKYDKIKNEYDDKQVQENKTTVKRLAEVQSIKKLRDTVNFYGFSLTSSQIGMYLFAILIIPIIVAYVSKLQLKYIIVIAIISVITAPFLIFLFYKQKFTERRFEMVIDYLTNMLPIFMQKTKILYALTEIRPLLKYQMHSIVGEAIKYIEQNVDDPDAELTALEMIEMEFPNTRIKSLHRLMQSIEFKNSTKINDVCQNMYADIDAWIKRINRFLIDLKDRKIKIVILCVMTLGLNVLFTWMYTSSEFFKGFTDNTTYQIAGTIFIIVILIIAVASLAKLDGAWLINDATIDDAGTIKKQYKTWEKGQQKQTKQEISISIIFAALGAYMCVSGKVAIGVVLIGFVLVVLTNKKRKYSNAYKALNKHFQIEFPAWLREVTLELNTKTVLNAIEESMLTCSYPMYRQLELFMEEAHEKPNSIVPYSKMLSDFNLKESQTSLKVLYSVQQYGQDEIKDQVSSLIQRNQDSLDSAESLKNQSRLMGVEAIGFLPMGVLTILMIIDMVLLFGEMMNLMTNIQV